MYQEQLTQVHPWVQIEMIFLWTVQEEQTTKDNAKEMSNKSEKTVSEVNANELGNGRQRKRKKKYIYLNY